MSPDHDSLARQPLRQGGRSSLGLRALDRKLFRDLVTMRGQAIAIALVVACGVAAFVMALTAVLSLKRTRDGYYERQRFAQVFTRMKRAPESLAARIAAIPGVAAVQPRVVMEVTLDMPGMVEAVSGRLISIPEDGRQTLNRVYLRRGRWIRPDRAGEVLVSESFAEAHHLRPGGSFRAVINGRRHTLHVAGTALSPEYVYEVRPGEILPDPARFGVIWMGHRELAQVSGMEGAFNDTTLALMPFASLPEVLRRLDLITEPHGGAGAYGREDQISHRMVSDEILQMRAMALVPTSIFLAVASFLLHMVMSRLINTQREQIAAIRAFGYSGREIGWHYAKMAAVIVVAGALVGCVIGARLGRGITRMYARFFHFPVMLYEMDGWVVVLALAVSLIAAAGGVWGAVRQASRLPPAEAMRPETPPGFHAGWIERLMTNMANGARMTARNLLKRPVRTSLGVLGIGLAVAVLILGTFSGDMVDHVMDLQFQAAQRQDYTVTLMEPAEPAAVHGIASLPGVRRCEVFRSVPVRVTAGSRSRKLALTGHGDERAIFPVVDLDLKPVPLFTSGITISEKLGEVLGVSPGGRLRLEVLEGKRAVRDVEVRAFASDFSGMSAMMRIEGLWDLLGESPAISGAHISTDPREQARFHRAVKDTPRIASVTAKSALLESFRRTMAENLLRMKLFNVAFACVIAFGVVYNSARIALSERSREFATLRVLGFTRAEVSKLMLAEVGGVVLAGLPLGLVLGRVFALAAVRALETESQRFPLVIYPSTYAFAFSVIAIAAVFSGLVVRRKVDKLNMIAVLKARD